MAVAIQLELTDQGADVINHYQDYGFASREALVERALQLLEEKAEQSPMLVQSYKIQTQPGYKTPVLPAEELTDAEKAEARETVLRGNPGMDIESLLEYVKESRQDRQLPYRNDE